MEPDPNFVKMLLNISSKNSDDLIKLCDSSRSLRAYCKRNEQLNERYVNAVAKKNMEKLISKYVEESDLTKKEQIAEKALVKIKDLVSKRIKNPTETSVYDIPSKAIDMIVYALAFYIVLQRLLKPYIDSLFNTIKINIMQIWCLKKILIMIFTHKINK